MSVLCEVMARQIIPAVRVSVTKQLYNKHDLNQEEIATALGISQAAVSKYLSSRYTRDIRKLERDRTVKRISDEVVGHILRKKFNRSSFETIVCKFCGEMLR